MTCNGGSEHSWAPRTGGQRRECTQQPDERFRLYAVVLEKRQYADQSGLRHLSIHVSGIIAARNPFLMLLFELAQPVAQQAQRRELM